jgi:RHS repeat-associated protein
LQQVRDAIGNTAASNDIDNQNANNYVYDEIGNLIQDESENITNIVWSIYGKVLELTKDDNYNVTTIAYDYDATGNRVAKLVKIGIKELINGGTSTSIRFNKQITTAYFRDAQGNVLQTTVKKHDNNTGNTIYTNEYVIYGSSRLGTYEPEKSPYYSGYQGITKGKLTLGYKNYELSNHLGNVLTTIADNKFFATPASGTGLSLFARVATSQDYYPFGMAMAERSFKENTDKKYRFGFNGKEYENDISEGVYNFEARMMDSRICRFTSTDPLSYEYPDISPFVFVGNMPLIAIDPNGQKLVFVGKEEDVKYFKALIKLICKMSPEAKDIIRTLKKSKNVHTIHALPKYIDPKYVYSLSPEKQSEMKYDIDFAVDLAKRKKEKLISNEEVKEIKDTQRAGPIVISNTNSKFWLTGEDDEKHLNGEGTGSIMYITTRYMRNEGIAIFCHELYHMYTIDAGKKSKYCMYIHSLPSDLPNEVLADHKASEICSQILESIKEPKKNKMFLEFHKKYDTINRLYMRLLYNEKDLPAYHDIECEVEEQCKPPIK